LQRLEGLSKSEWNRIRLRRKDTKVYATAISDLGHLSSIYPERRAQSDLAAAEAKRITRQYAPTISFNTPWELGNAAGDAVRALIELSPWGPSFERLYGPFSEVIPIRSIEPTARALDLRSVERVQPMPAVGLQSPEDINAVVTPDPRHLPVDYWRAMGFFGGEFFVLAIFLFIGAQAAILYGPLGWIIGGGPAAAAFFALKVSRGPIASIQIIQYERRLKQLKNSDKATYDFVMRCREIVTTIGAILCLFEAILFVGLLITQRH